MVITMGCGDACPIFPGKRYEDWELADPAGQGIEAVLPIRDEIRSRVEALVAELTLTPPAGWRRRDPDTKTDWSSTPGVRRIDPWQL